MDAETWALAARVQRMPGRPAGARATLPRSVSGRRRWTASTCCWKRRTGTCAVSAPTRPTTTPESMPSL
jgi:hypothetical protein